MPALPEFIPLEKNKAMYAVNWRDSPQTTAATQPTVSSSATVPSTQSEKDNATQGKGGHRSRRGRRGKSRLSQRQQDADDFFVNCVLPNGVTFNKLMSELNFHETTPLHAYDIGPPCALLPRRNSSTGVTGMELMNMENIGSNGGTPGTLTMGTTTTTTTTTLTTTTGEFPSDMTTTIGVSGRSSSSLSRRKPRQNPVNLSPFSTPVVPVVTTNIIPTEDGDDVHVHSLPDLILPPSVPSEILLKGHLISLLFAESSEAEKVSELVQKKWPQATVMIASRNRSILNSSLVLKGLPSLAKTERIIEEFEKVIPHKSSYIRLHRGERGVFKNVVFVKYPTRDIAEESKLRLERFTIGSRLLKVEFKKKERGTLEREKEVTLQQLVRDLRISTEHEGFIYQREDLTRDEIKLLKQLCNSYGHSFDLNEHTVTVKRVLPGSGRPSPAIRSSVVTMPSTNSLQATPFSLRPIDFKGPRFSAALRGNHLALDYVHAKNSGELPAFAPGRGRPV